jgi:hypothetical protein
MQSPEQFQTAAQQRLEGFYSNLAQWGEVAPGVRFRLEGYLQAGIDMGLLQRTQLQSMIEASYRSHMGKPPPPSPAPTEHVQLPVYWQRAPVYASGKTGSR